MTVITKQPVNPIAHLSPEDIEQIGIELDAIRQDVIDASGDVDAAYIRKVIDVQRKLELGSRAVLLVSIFPPAWIAGTVGLSMAKILENMEIGHNILHGQWDWMRDPKIHSTTWEWDMATPSEQLAALAQRDPPHVHEHRRQGQRPRLRHHAGRRGPALAPDVPRPARVELHQRLLLRVRHRGLRPRARREHQAQEDQGSRVTRSGSRACSRKIRKQATKDYVVHPALSLPTGSFLPTLVANFTANVVRNLWSHSVIMCGHFPEGVETFERKSIDPNETRGDWYVRQMLGSANISGSKTMHVLTGNLSHQIEHHLFPDLPSRRYAEVAPRVKDLFEKYDLNYHMAPLPQQVYSAWHKVVRLSLPNGWLETTNARNAAAAARACSTDVDGRTQGPSRRPGPTAAAGPQGRCLSHAG